MTSKRYTRTLMASLATMLTLNFLLPRAALAAPPPEPHPTTTATLTDYTPPNQLFNGLYAPTSPDTWCQLGMATPIRLDDNQVAGINSTGCQIVGPDDDGLSVVGQNSNADHTDPPFFTTCQGEQGPANEADIDPSGVAIHCTNYDGEGENAYVHINLAGPGFSAHTDASTVWADLYGTSGYLGNGTYTVTGTGSSQTLSITEGGNTVTLSPPPAFTQATGWVEITTDTTTQCLYIDNAPPSCGGHTSWITDLDIGGDGSPSPAPYQWWGYGAWQDATVAAILPPDLGRLRLPRMPRSLRNPLRRGQLRRNTRGPRQLRRRRHHPHHRSRRRRLHMGRPPQLLVRHDQRDIRRQRRRSLRRQRTRRNRLPRRSDHAPQR